MKALDWHDTAGSVVETGGVWSSTVVVIGDRGQTSDTLTATLHGPDDDTEVADAATVDRIGHGYYRVTVTVPTDVGLYRVKVAGTNDTLWHVLDATDPYAALPNLDDVKLFLGTTASTQYGDAKITRALEEERAAQLDAIDFPSTGYTRSLRRALLRRVQVNLAQDGQPLTVSDGDGGVIRVSGVDPVVRQLERRYPRSPAG